LKRWVRFKVAVVVIWDGIGRRGRALFDTDMTPVATDVMVASMDPESRSTVTAVTVEYETAETVP